MLSLLVINIFVLAFKIQPILATGTIYINPDGSITPTTANITTSDFVTYRFTDNNYASIVVDRNNTVIDGAGYAVQGSGSGYGIDLTSKNNVTIRNTQVKSFYSGVNIQSSSNVTIVGNNITGNMDHGIRVDSSNQSDIVRNHVSLTRGAEGDGIWLRNSRYNSVDANIISSNGDDGIQLGWVSVFNDITENYVTNSTNDGIWVADSCIGNRIFHNNFVGNHPSGVCIRTYPNIWDDGYPSGGNYWSDFPGTDHFSGPYQNLTGSDGISDTPHVINIDNSLNNTDHYPLMSPWLPHDVAVTNALPFKTIVGQGCSIRINVTVANLGNFTETFNVSTGVIPVRNVGGVQSVVGTESVSGLMSGEKRTITIELNSTILAYGNYTIEANASIVSGETRIADNFFKGGLVLITVTGDVNGDKTVNVLDLILIATHLGQSNGGGYTPYSLQWYKSNNCDLNNDNRVNVLDLIASATHLGQHW